MFLKDYEFCSIFVPLSFPVIESQFCLFSFFPKKLEKAKINFKLKSNPPENPPQNKKRETKMSSLLNTVSWSDC